VRSSVGAFTEVFLLRVKVSIEKLWTHAYMLVVGGSTWDVGRAGPMVLLMLSGACMVISMNLGTSLHAVCYQLQSSFST
jgi:hypothetical protein